MNPERSRATRSPPAEKPHAAGWGHLLPWTAALAFYFLGADFLGLGTNALIMVLFALSLDLVLGYAGIITMGHAAFFGFGAYAAGLCAIHVTNDPVTGLLIATAAAGILGFVTGTLILHTKGVTLMMLTLAIGALVAEVANHLRDYTGGDDGLHGIRMAPLLGAFRFDLWGHTAYLYTLAVLLAWFALAWRIMRSPFGRSLDGIRQNVRRMRAIGTPVWWRMVAVYSLGAAMAGTAGALSAQTTRAVGLTALELLASGTVLMVLILGGTRRLYGAFAGAVVYVVVQDFAAQVDPFRWMFVIGALLMAVVLFLENGLMGIIDFAAARARSLWREQTPR
ncbi:MAG: branched-chain amino acid ABC transporter permease [Betaproteobacteria bacterium]|nr:branched-chain amino acid ABC transporter permease [Betaproteobacteria bacterium]